MIKIEKVENDIDLITLKNDELEVVVSNYGCTLVKVLMPILGRLLEELLIVLKKELLN